MGHILRVAGGKRSRRDDKCTRLRELHYSTASVFQAVLGIDLDLDDRSDRESEAMGYTSLRPVSPGGSSISSLRVFRRSSGPQIIQMEMSPRVPRSVRTCRTLAPTPPTGDTYRRPGNSGAATFRRPREPSGSALQPSSGRAPARAGILRVGDQNGATPPRPKETGSVALLPLPEQNASGATSRCPERNTRDLCGRPAEAEVVETSVATTHCSGVNGGRAGGMDTGGAAVTVSPTVIAAGYLGDLGTAC
ncbi:uncharacterized protein LOC122377745 [Amphibalanus amphitrite]|uniref:uncharacterized protein LOC122377745 n=1 Tax=Amphibalanus amphitrite TaxID=1232801 RepID=UPI001C927D18|nr:uncharacterized protein LOC122377745 [Amphibalanus amphitrite]